MPPDRRRACDTAGVDLTESLLVRAVLAGALPFITSCGGPIEVKRVMLLDAAPPQAGRSLPGAQCEALCAPYLEAAGRSCHPAYIEGCELVTVDAVGGPPARDGAVPPEGAAPPEAARPAVLCHITEFCPGGRRPRGYCGGRESESSPGAYLAELARLELASVGAFRALARDLAAHGAPAHLVRQATVAARQEVAHGRLVSALALRRGHQVEAPPATPPSEASLHELACDNAAEGCVREGYGALVAGFVARRARAADVRAVFTRIAREEAEHARLALAVHRWATTRLAPRARQQIQEQARATLGELEQAVAIELGPLHDELGLPSPSAAAALLRGYGERLLTPGVVG